MQFNHSTAEDNVATDVEVKNSSGKYMLAGGCLVSDADIETLRGGGLVSRVSSYQPPLGAYYGVTRISEYHFGDEGGDENHVDLIKNPDAIARVLQVDPIDMDNREHVRLFAGQYELSEEAALRGLARARGKIPVDVMTLQAVDDTYVLGGLPSSIRESLIAAYIVAARQVSGGLNVSWTTEPHFMRERAAREFFRDVLDSVNQNLIDVAGHGRATIRGVVGHNCGMGAPVPLLELRLTDWRDAASALLEGYKCMCEARPASVKEAITMNLGM